MFCHLVDDDIQLKLLEVQDAGELFALTDGSRTYLREWLPWVDATTSVADSKAFIESSLAQFAAHDGFQAGILHRGKLAGAIGLHTINWPNRHSAIGYWLGEGFQGQGIMTRACEALLDIAFHEYGLNRVEIQAGVENQKSRSIPERLGFHQEGVSRQSEWVNDRFLNQVVYSMLASEWRQKTSSSGLER